jgi:hypothetical protein
VSLDLSTTLPCVAALYVAVMGVRDVVFDCMDAQGRR